MDESSRPLSIQSEEKEKENKYGPKWYKKSSKVLDETKCSDGALQKSMNSPLYRMNGPKIQMFLKTLDLETGISKKGYPDINYVSVPNKRKLAVELES